MYSAILVNDEVLDTEELKNEAVIRESKILWQLINKENPSLFTLPI